MTPDETFEQVANLLDSSGISAEDAMKICSAICIGICVDSHKPKQVYIQYMSDAWNHFAQIRKEGIDSCH